MLNAATHLLLRHKEILVHPSQASTDQLSEPGFLSSPGFHTPGALCSRQCSSTEMNPPLSPFYNCSCGAERYWPLWPDCYVLCTSSLVASKAQLATLPHHRP